ncbi:Ammonium transmembrane transporter activity protein [Halocaridina rubra]|uniref:Ammonium transmembrane transporter activity protein n=1 Tax=Halocaridina rubra TaxID=373956 RepID=A0AAN9A0B5_HALRR
MAYVLFSAVNTLVYCIPAGWLWGNHGFLFKLGAVDIAGSSGVHLCGGASALVASKLVGPRIGRYDQGTGSLPMGSPTNAILGTFMLWWGWLGFNCGSTFGISGDMWKYAARTAVTTLLASIGGGLAGMAYSWYKNRRLSVGDVVNSVLGALVSITAGCALFTTWESLLVGTVGGILAVLSMPLVDSFHIDDPVGAVAVHGGGFYLLGVQTLTCVCITAWAMISTYLILKGIDKFIVSIRMSEWEELVGADFSEHGIRRRGVGVSRAVSVLGYIHHGQDYSDIAPQGDNPRHQDVLEALETMASRRASTLSKAVAQVTDTKTYPKSMKIPSLVVNGLIAKQRDTPVGSAFGNRVDVRPVEHPSYDAWK